MTTAITHPTFADLVRPKSVSRARLYDAGLVVGASLFVALCAQVSIPMASGVPITGQTFAVLLVGAALGPIRGGAALALYLAQGLAGLPVFAGLQAGFQPVTMGYLIAFAPAAFVVGGLARRGWDRGVLRTAAMMTIGTAVIFAGGLAWLAGLASLTDRLGDTAVLAAGLWPYLPGAAIKIALATALLPAGWRIVGGRG